MADHNDLPKPAANTAGSASATLSDVTAALKVVFQHFEAAAPPATSQTVEQDDEAPESESKQDQTKPAARAAGKRKRSSSKFDISYGVLRMRAYPVTEMHLTNLSLIDVFAGALFSIFTGCAVYVIDVSRDLSLAAPDADPVPIAFWSGTRIAVAIFGALALVGAVFAVAHRRGAIKRIKEETDFVDG